MFLLETLKCEQERIEDIINPPYRPYPHRNPAKVVLDVFQDPVFPRGLSDSQSYNVCPHFYQC